MNKEYERPTLTVYGDIGEITQATGIGGNDLIVTGPTVVVDGVTTNTTITNITVPGSGPMILGL